MYIFSTLNPLPNQLLNTMKNLIIVFVSLLFLASCGGNSTSGAQVEESTAGTMLPAVFIGVYKGTLTVTAKAAGLTESDMFEITVTVTPDGMIKFDGDDPDETFTVGLMNNGEFSGNLAINEDPCKGTVGVTGKVNGAGTTVSGTVKGEGVCEEGILKVDVDLEGTFTATK